MPDYEYRYHAVNALDRHVISAWTNQETAEAMRGDGERDNLDEWIERRIKAGPVERIESPKNGAHSAAQEVIDAWIVKGPAPAYHEHWKNIVRTNWPALAQALDALTAETGRAGGGVRRKVCSCWRLRPDGSHGRGCDFFASDEADGGEQ